MGGRSWISSTPSLDMLKQPAHSLADSPTSSSSSFRLPASKELPLGPHASEPNVEEDGDSSSPDYAEASNLNLPNSNITFSFDAPMIGPTASSENSSPSRNISEHNLDGIFYMNMNENLILRKSSHERWISTRLKDYVCNTVCHSTEKSHSSSALPTSSATQDKSLYAL